jgi:gliding motility-associated-like protein
MLLKKFLYTIIIISAALYTAESSEIDKAVVAKTASDKKFLENKGQWPADVLFRANIPGGAVYLTKNAFIYSFYDVEATRSHKHCHPCKDEPVANAKKHLAKPGQKINAHSYSVELVGSRPGAIAYGAGAGLEEHNFFLGNDPSKWASRVKAFQEVWYSEIYPGIDLRFYNQRNELKYDFVVKPGADPSVITLKYDGVEDIYLKDGHLHVVTTVNKVLEEMPYAFQLNKKDTISINCSYTFSDHTLSFQLDKYDKMQRLIIDPLLIFSTYSGSHVDNWGNTATYDDEGNLYSGGIAQGIGFPVTPGAYQIDFGGVWDVSILKYDSTGSYLKYATYLGGGYAETPQSLVVNNSGELLIFGTTSSPDFPVVNGYQTVYKGGNPTEALRGIVYENGSDMFIAKLSADGSKLMASTYLGGTANDGINYTRNPLVKNYGDQYRGDIFAGVDGSVYVASNTSSIDFPLVNAWQSTYGGGTHDGVVFKMSHDLSQLLWSSYLGGNDVDAAYSIKVNTQNQVFVAGGTISTDFKTTPGTFMPTKPGGIDGFVVRINQQTHSIDKSTYIGTPHYDQVYFLDLDQQGFVYLLGQTQGKYPVVARSGKTLYENANSGQFIQKLTSNLEFSPDCFSTVFGSGSGSPDISLTAFMINDCGDIYVSGWGGDINAPIFNGQETRFIGGRTDNLPVSSDAFQKTTDGSDFYLMVLHPDAQALMYATFFGGSKAPGEHVDGGTSRFDKKGIVYQAVCAGCWQGREADFPYTENAWSKENLSYNCNNAAFKFDLASLSANFTTNSIFYDHPGLDEGCYPLDIVFQNLSIGGKSFFWDFGNGVTSTQKDNIRVRFHEPGVYFTTLIAFDPSTCKKIDYASKFIKVYDHDFRVSPSDSICFGDEIQLFASGGKDYIWSPPSSLSDPTIPNPVASPESTTHYVIRATNEFDCKLIDTVSIYVVPDVTAAFEMKKDLECSGFPLISFTNAGSEDVNYLWDFGDGTTSSEKNPVYQYQSVGNYAVRLKAWSGNCQSEASVNVQIKDFLAPNIFTPNGDGYNDYFELPEENLRLEVYNRWGKKVYESDAYKNNWSGNNLPTGTYFYRIVFEDNRSCNGWVHLFK